MIVVVFLVVTAAQSYNTEQRISANESDRKLALSLAEAALREGEFQVLDLEYAADSKVTFSENCEKGLCTAVNVRTNDNGNEEAFGNIVVQGKPTVEAVKRPCPAKSGKNSTYCALTIREWNIRKVRETSAKCRAILSNI